MRSSCIAAIKIALLRSRTCRVGMEWISESKNVPALLIESGRGPRSSALPFKALWASGLTWAPDGHPLIPLVGIWRANRIMDDLRGRPCIHGGCRRASHVVRRREPDTVTCELAFSPHHLFVVPAEGGGPQRVANTETGGSWNGAGPTTWLDLYFTQSKTANGRSARCSLLKRLRDSSRSRAEGVRERHAI